MGATSAVRPIPSSSIARYGRLGVFALTAALATSGLGGAVRAEPSHPTLVVAFHTEPARRAALRAALQGEQAQRLRAWRRAGLLASYRLLFSRYADRGVWDGLEVLDFRDEAGLAAWKAVERASPGGAGPQTVSLVTSVVTTPADRVRTASVAAGGSPVFLVIPYQASVPIPEYVGYLDDYTLPQFRGWMEEGVLAGYEVDLSRYPAGRPWASTILLEYRDDAALSRREEVVGRVRARLAANPRWKAISDNKKSIRTEGALAVADQLAFEGAAR